MAAVKYQKHLPLSFAMELKRKIIPLEFRQVEINTSSSARVVPASVPGSRWSETSDKRGCPERYSL